MLKACNDDVAAPESTRALIAGNPSPGREHHSSLPTMSLLVKAAVGPYRESEKPRSFRESAKTIQGLSLDPRVTET